MTDGFDRYWPTVIRYAANCNQMFSSKLEVLQVFNTFGSDSGKNYIRRGILNIIFFITGSGFFFLLYHTFNQFGTKSPSGIENTVIYKPNKYNLEHRDIVIPVTFEDTLYCNISRCKSLICSSIPAPLDSGKEASRFIKNTFKKQCSTSIKIESLIFQNCYFFNNILGPAWLQSDLSIDVLSFNNCQLKEIHDDAFSLPFYTSLKCLSVTQNNISTLRIVMFKMLVNLESFVMHSNIINFAESNLLGNLAGSLQTLELDNSIENADVLKNITGRSPLPKIEILSIKGNSLPILSADLFKGVPNVKSIYTDHSEIKDVLDDTFQPVAKSLEQLFMRYNNIMTLRSGVLESILKQKSNFYLNIDDNPWHCDCSMKWMQILMQEHPGIVVNDPICLTPENNAGSSFTKVKFCNDSGVQSSTTISTTTENGSKVSQKLNVTCDTLLPLLDHEYFYKSLLLDVKHQFKRLTNFFVKEMANGSILVSASNIKPGFTLIWFSNEELMLNSDNIKNNVKCIESVRSSIILKRLKPAAPYTICLLEANETSASPLNCLALITSSEYKSRVWLSNGDKPLVISLCAIILFFLSLTGAIVSYIVIRRNPTLLRGSKRVLIVGRHTINAVVLPEGVQINSCGNTEINDKPSTLDDHDYLTPLGFSQSMRKDSQRSGESSLSSGASYISGIEPNLIQLATWRIHRLKNSNFREVEKTPPLPPNHPVNIPSLSYAVDLKGNDDSLE